MTQDQKQQAKQIFIEMWNNPEIDSKDLHTEIQVRLTDEGIIAPGSVLTEESVRKSFMNIGEEYGNYRKRPRKKEGIVFDFTEEVETPIDTVTHNLDF